MERHPKSTRPGAPWGDALASCALVLAVLASPSAGAPMPPIPTDRNDAGPDLFDAYNLLTGSDYAGNADLMPHVVADAGLFTRGGESLAIAIGSSAANRNTFGLYEPQAPGTRTPLLSDVTGFGFLGPAFETALFPAGSAGFYLETSGHNDDVWHSQPALDARGRADHLIAFQLPDTLRLDTDRGPVDLAGGWLLGWEDLRDGDSDGDYDDLIVAVGSVGTAPEASVPEPGTGALLALGLFALARTRPIR